jgi:hypothetical protein
MLRLLHSSSSLEHPGGDEMSFRWSTFIALLLYAAQSHADEPAAPQPAPGPRQGAAETVQEGNVELWLQHYQRERGEKWPQFTQVEPNAADERSADPPNAGEPAPTAR